MRLFVLVSLCLMMLVADLHFRYLEMVRQAVSVLIYPLERAAVTPAELVRNAAQYLSTLVEVQRDNQALRRKALGDAERLLRQADLERENTRLRGLMRMSSRVQATSIAADVLYEARDAFSRKVILDRGAQHEVTAGQVVVDEVGVVGQVTRVYPIQSEVTLITDKGQAIPVRVERTGQPGVLYGGGRGALSLRYLLANADVQTGDRIVTSGLDGVFLAGIPVATVTSVERDRLAFAQIECEPLAGVRHTAQVMILGRATPSVLPPSAKPAADSAPAAED